MITHGNLHMYCVGQDEVKLFLHSYNHNFLLYKRRETVQLTEPAICIMQYATNEDESVQTT